MTNISKSLRERLKSNAEIRGPEVVSSHFLRMELASGFYALPAVAVLKLYIFLIMDEEPCVSPPRQVVPWIAVLLHG